MQKDFKESTGCNTSIVLESSSSFPLIIILVVATERIFIEGVNFQRITNSKRIRDSWFRFEIFWMNFSWKNAIGIGKMSLGRRFYKVQAGSKWKRRGLLGSETFYMWSCTLVGLDCVRPHVYLSLAWALLFQLNVALLLELLNESIAQKYSRPVWALENDWWQFFIYTSFPSPFSSSTVQVYSRRGEEFQKN